MSSLKKENPVRNGYIESLMDKLRDESLNLYLFRNIYEARTIIGNYTDYYNNEKPHSSIGYDTLTHFDKKLYTIKL